MKTPYIIGHSLLVGAVCVFCYKSFASNTDNTVVKNESIFSEVEAPSTSSLSFSEKSQSLIDRAKEELEDELIIGETYWDMPAKPFEVVLSKQGFEWTAEDGRLSKVVRVLSTNPAEYEMLMEANQWTSRRKLVYLPQDFDNKAEQVFNGQLKEFTIPFFEGELLKVQIEDVAPADEAIGAGPVSGSFYGTFQGDGDERIPVYLAASEGVWSIGFNKNNFEYVIENRGETNEIFISETDLLRRNMVLGTPPCDTNEHYSTDNVGDFIDPETTGT